MIAAVPNIDMACCPICGTPAPAEWCNTDKTFACGRCSSKLLVEVFPAQYRRNANGDAGEAIVEASDASCFFHPQKKAAVVCSSCGRFLCQLCQIEHAGASICPTCLQKGRESEEIQTLVTQRTLHDSIALGVATIPLLIFWLTIITAPAALFWALRSWNKPTSLLPRTRFRLVLAILLSLLQIAGWIFLFIKIFED